MRIGPRWRALQRVGESDLKIAGARVNFPAGGKNMKGGSEGREARCVWGPVNVRLKLSFRGPVPREVKAPATAFEQRNLGCSGALKKRSPGFPTRVGREKVRLGKVFRSVASHLPQGVTGRPTDRKRLEIDRRNAPVVSSRIRVVEEKFRFVSMQVSSSIRYFWIFVWYFEVSSRCRWTRAAIFFY